MIARIAFALLAAVALVRAWKPWPYSAETESDSARAVALHPRSTVLRTAYALTLETSGDATGAERELLEAARNDHQYAPAWQLADFYFRDHRPHEFLTWAHLAAERSYGDLSALFRLAEELQISDEAIASQLLVRPAIERNYAAWLLERMTLDRKSPDKITTVASLLARRNNPEDRELLLAIVDAYLTGGDADRAARVWGSFQHQEKNRPGDALLFHPNFEAPPLGRGFDWRPAAIDGVRQFPASAEDPRTTGWTIEFSGRQAEICDLLTQYVVLEPGRLYSLEWVAVVPPALQSSFFWRLGDRQVFENKPTPADRRLDQLVLRYRRMPGQLRFEGRIVLKKILFRPALALASPEDR